MHPSIRPHRLLLKIASGLVALALGGCAGMLAEGSDPGRDLVSQIDSKHVTMREQVTRTMGQGRCESESARAVTVVYPYHAIPAKRRPMFDVSAIQIAPALLLCPPWGPPAALFALVAEPAIAVADVVKRTSNPLEKELSVQYDRAGRILSARVLGDAPSFPTTVRPPPPSTPPSSAP